MSGHVLEMEWLDARAIVTQAELARICGLTEPELVELTEYGALHPLPGGAADAVYSAECVPTLRQAGRLRRDFELDLFAVAVLLDYLNRIEALERQIKALQAHLPKHAPPPDREGPKPWHEPHG